MGLRVRHVVPPVLALLRTLPVAASLQEERAYASWLDVWVALTAQPPGNLTGILGSTWRPGAASAATSAGGTHFQLNASLIAADPF